MTGRRKVDERPELIVHRDSDQGITVRDPLSGVVLSIISTHPLANGPKGLIVEAYGYESNRRIEQQDTPREQLRNKRTTVTTFYAVPAIEDA